MVHTRKSFEALHTSPISVGKGTPKVKKSVKIQVDHSSEESGLETAPFSSNRRLRYKKERHESPSKLKSKRNGRLSDRHNLRSTKAPDDKTIAHDKPKTCTTTKASEHVQLTRSLPPLDKARERRRRLSEEEEEEELIEPSIRRSARQRRGVYETLNINMLTDHRYVHSYDNYPAIVKMGKREKKRQQIDEMELEDDNFFEDDHINMYDHVKRRHETPTPEKQPRDRTLEEGDGDDEDDEDNDDNESEEDDSGEEEEEEEEIHRENKYLLRKKKPAVNRYMAPPMRKTGEKKDYLSVRKKMHHNPPPHTSPVRRIQHKRKAINMSSSTSSSEESSIEKEEKRFERRKSKSTAKARLRALPINLTIEDISKGILRDRDRIGSSLADVDPMSIDQKVHFDCVGGLAKQIRGLKEMILFPLIYPEVFGKFKITPPRGVLFYGPPGTGKTLVARALANECSVGNHKVAFFMRKGADCLSKWVGESERQLRLLFDQAYSMRPSIIFFDEIDGLAPVRSSRQDQIHSSIVSTLLALMDGLDSRGEVVVIGATNRIDAIDPALRRPGRFDREFQFPLPDKQANTKTMLGNSSNQTPTTGSKSDQRFKHYESFNDGDDMSSDDEDDFPSIYDHSIINSACSLSRSERYMRRTKQRFEPSNDVLHGSHRLYSFSEELYKNPITYRPRLLLAGKEGGGQTSHLAPAILHCVEHLSVYPLDLPALYGVTARTPEEACSQLFREARRSSPSIIYMPHINSLWNATTDSLHATLLSLLQDLPPLCPVLLLATTERDFILLPIELCKLFSTQTDQVLHTGLPNSEERRAFFKKLFLDFALQTTKVKKAKKNRTLVVLPLAPAPVPRQLSDPEIKKMQLVEENTLRELRIFLRDVHHKLIVDRRFKEFSKAVDLEEVPDYLNVVDEPMDMSTMMQKIDCHHYNTCAQYLLDIDLITSNALKYNPDIDPLDKIIRHRACELRDTAHSLIKSQLEPEFEKVCALTICPSFCMRGDNSIKTAKRRDLCDKRVNTFLLPLSGETSVCVPAYVHTLPKQSQSIEKNRDSSISEPTSSPPANDQPSTSTLPSSSTTLDSGSQRSTESQGKRKRRCKSYWFGTRRRSFKKKNLADEIEKVVDQDNNECEEKVDDQNSGTSGSTQQPHLSSCHYDSHQSTSISSHELRNERSSPSGDCIHNGFNDDSSNGSSSREKHDSSKTDGSSIESSSSREKHDSSKMDGSSIESSSSREKQDSSKTDGSSIESSSSRDKQDSSKPSSIQTTTGTDEGIYSGSGVTPSVSQDTDDIGSSPKELTELDGELNGHSRHLPKHLTATTMDICIVSLIFPAGKLENGDSDRPQCAPHLTINDNHWDLGQNNRTLDEKDDSDEGQPDSTGTFSEETVSKWRGELHDLLTQIVDMTKRCTVEALERYHNRLQLSVHQHRHTGDKTELVNVSENFTVANLLVLRCGHTVQHFVQFCWQFCCSVCQSWN
ncbi:hypothetical protein QZH41_008494 [Actinostola sp. cb2023]|nr:hypothetical protein QZH41_008494 [Actinostola sp. cb2023]